MIHVQYLSKRRKRQYSAGGAVHTYEISRSLDPIACKKVRVNLHQYKDTDLWQLRIGRGFSINSGTFRDLENFFFVQLSYRIYQWPWFIEPTAPKEVELGRRGVYLTAWMQDSLDGTTTHRYYQEKVISRKKKEAYWHDVNFPKRLDNDLYRELIHALNAYVGYRNAPPWEVLARRYAFLSAVRDQTFGVKIIYPKNL